MKQLAIWIFIRLILIIAFVWALFMACWAKGDFGCNEVSRKITGNYCEKYVHFMRDDQ